MGLFILLANHWANGGKNDNRYTYNNKRKQALHLDSPSSIWSSFTAPFRHHTPRMGQDCGGCAGTSQDFVLAATQHVLLSPLTKIKGGLP
jgi:hypothetical protein